MSGQPKDAEDLKQLQARRRTALVEIIAILQSVDMEEDPGMIPARLLNAAAAYYGLTPVAALNDGAGDGQNSDGW